MSQTWEYDLTLSFENYKQAVLIFQNWYGTCHILISAYMDSLLKIRKVKSSDGVINLWKLLLIPTLKDRLPDDLKLYISRKFSSEI